MKRLFGIHTVMAVGAAVMLAVGTAAAEYSPNDDPGTPGQDNMYNRVIPIQPNTKYVNVSGDEIIKFVDSTTGRSFVWNFNTPADTIALSRIAPTGMFGGRSITIYRALSQRELNRNRSKD